MKRSREFRPTVQRVLLITKPSIACVLLLASSNVLSGPKFNDVEDLPEPGFSWELSVGAGLGKITPSLEEGSDSDVSSGSTSGSDVILKSLDATQKSENETMPMLNVEAEYVFSNRKTLLNFSFDELGVSHMFDSGLVLSAGIGSFIDSEEIFRDPYLTNAVRQTETTRAPSFRLGAEGMFGMPVSLEYSFTSLNVSNDKAGTSLLNKGGKFGIKSSELKLLKRSFKSHSIALATELPVNDHLSLMPVIGYHMINAEGKANSAKGFEIGLNAQYEIDRYAIDVGVSYSPLSYDKSHPVFDKTREDKSISYEIQFSMDEPFGFKDQQFHLGFGHADKGSNIKFYDSSESTFYAAWSFSF